MQNILHRGAKTTPKIRKEIHDSTESLMVLAQRYNLNFKTILKWKHREDFSDKPSGAIKPKSVLSDQEQAVICEFRRITQLPLDDVFVALKDKIPALTRSNLYRCLKRFGYQKLPKDSILKKEHQSFKTYELGFIHLDIVSLHTAEAKAQGDQSTTIECGYDYMGRRYTKKVTSNGTVSLQQRYIYRGYLQIASVDLTRSEHPAFWYITWDPTEPIATRPLAIQKNATWYTYSHDLTKNVTELYQSDGLIATTYDYSPYGIVTAEGIDQPIQYSSEYHDPELALTYYNYRHYNPRDGRWINRDPIGEDGGFNLYGFVSNSSGIYIDILGNWLSVILGAVATGLVIGVVIVVRVNNIRKSGEKHARIRERLYNDDIPKGNVEGAIQADKEAGKAMQEIAKETVKLAKTIPGTSLTGYPNPLTVDILDLIVEGIIPAEDAKGIQTIADIIQLVNSLRKARLYSKECYTEKDKERLDERIREIDGYLKSKGYDRVGNPKEYHEYVDGHL